METKTDKAQATREIVAGMLTENTGSHMLDSGGDSGRMWQRNAGLTVEAFEAMPRVTLDHSYGDVSLSVYHHMTENLEFDPELDADFQAYRADMDESDLSIIESYAKTFGTVDNYLGGTFNSYNWENNLSQVLQGHIFKLGDTSYALIQVHGGADVRGGYTRPRMFKVLDSESFLLNMDAFTLECAGDPEHKAGQLDLEGQDTGAMVHEWNYSGEWIEGEPLNLYDMANTARNNGLDFIPCPECGTRLTAS